MKRAQDLMRDLYFKRDSERDFGTTVLKLMEEIGELSEAIIQKDKPKQEEELADVIAWLLSIANLLDIDAEKAFYDKYPNVCKRCGNSPCTCEQF